MSTVGGLWQALERGDSIGCTTIQIFTKNGRQWKAKELTEQEITLFKLAQAKTGISPVIAHASYLINIGSARHEISTKSTDALIEELNRCSALDIPYLVVHPGSYGTATREQCLDMIIKNVNHALGHSTGSVTLLLETMAGQGSSVCSTFEELAYIIGETKKTKRIGICLDTCHIFAAGYDIRDTTSYHETWKKFDTLIGRHYLQAIHLNDSKKGLGSHVDRHEHIGQGHIGLDGFRLIMNDQNLAHIPKIIETPKEEDLSVDKHNLDTLKKLVKK